MIEAILFSAYFQLWAQCAPQAILFHNVIFPPPPGFTKHVLWRHPHLHLRLHVWPHSGPGLSQRGRAPQFLWGPHSQPELVVVLRPPASPWQPSPTHTPPHGVARWISSPPGRAGGPRRAAGGPRFTGIPPSHIRQPPGSCCANTA